MWHVIEYDEEEKKNITITCDLEKTKLILGLTDNNYKIVFTDIQTKKEAFKKAINYIHRNDTIELLDNGIIKCKSASYNKIVKIPI